MANATPSGTKIEYDNASDVLQDITPHVLTINEVDIESLSEEIHSFGMTFESFKPIGIARISQIELSGLYDDTAAGSPNMGPDALFANRAPETPASVTRTLKITWRTGKTTSVETYLSHYKRQADRNALTKYTAILLPFGTVTEV